uniref:Peptidase S74 domain-containing protein n=1 Tax=viral metagenome TaxID=1070528 RepID=A0A6C0LDT7_9ZZZZ
MPIVLGNSNINYKENKGTINPYKALIFKNQKVGIGVDINSILDNRLEVNGNINIPLNSKYKINNANFGYSNLDHKLSAGTNISISDDFKINNTYTLPTASDVVLGGIKVGNNLSIDANGFLSTHAPYTLPTASSLVLGGVIVGNNLSIDANGILTTPASIPYTLPTASSLVLGGIKVGDNLSIDENGILSTHIPYTLPTASSSVIGGVRVGNNLSIDANGILSIITLPTIYTLPTASDVVLGGIRVGNNLSITGGVLSTHIPYTLPTASSLVLGGIKVGDNLSIDANGILSIITPPTTYTLPTASDVVLGGIRVGNNLSITDGVLSTHIPYTLPTASSLVLGGIIVGNNLSIDTNGILSTHTPYTLPTASTSVLGGIRVDGTTIAINDGVISYTGGFPKWATSGNNIYNTNTLNVGIGTTNPQSRLHIFNDISDNTTLNINNIESGSCVIELRRANDFTHYFGDLIIDGHRDFKIGNYDGDFIVKSTFENDGVIYDAAPSIKMLGTNGNIYNFNNSLYWSQTSDRRIKENIEGASYDKCYENIHKINLYRFNYIKEFKTGNQDTNQLGFIAQEIEDIFPKSVFTNSYNSDELNIPDMLSIDIGQINYALYGAVKKLIKMNNDKELRLKRLEDLLNIRRDA